MFFVYVAVLKKIASDNVIFIFVINEIRDYKDDSERERLSSEIYFRRKVRAPKSSVAGNSRPP